MWNSIIIPSPMHLLNKSDRPKNSSHIKSTTYGARFTDMVKPALLNSIPHTTKYLQSNSFSTETGFSTDFDGLIPTYLSNIDFESNKNDAMLGQRFGHRIPYKVPKLMPQLLKPPIVSGLMMNIKNLISQQQDNNFGILDTIYQAGSMFCEIFKQNTEKIINEETNVTNENCANSEEINEMNETNLTDSISNNSREEENSVSKLFFNVETKQKDIMQFNKPSVSVTSMDSRNPLKNVNITAKDFTNDSSTSSINGCSMPSKVSNSPSRKKRRSRKKMKKCEAKNAAALSCQAKDKLENFTEQFETLKVGGARRVTNRRRHKRKQSTEYASNMPKPSSSGCQKVYQMGYDDNALVNDAALIFPNCKDDICFEVPLSSYTATIPNGEDSIDCRNSAIAFILNGNDDIYESDSEFSLSDDQDDWQMFKEDFVHFQDCLLSEGNFNFTKTRDSELEICDEQFHFIITSENIDQGYIAGNTTSASLLLAVNQKWNEDTKDQDEKMLGLKASKVHFPPDESLCRVKVFEKSIEEDECENDWFLYKLMRCRFRKRVSELEPILSPCLEKNYRNKIFERQNCSLNYI